MNRSVNRRHPPWNETTSGILFTAVQIIIFFTFIRLCVFNTDVLQRNFMQTQIPVSFVLGALVILSGIILTTLYVLIANHYEDN